MTIRAGLVLLTRLYMRAAGAVAHHVWWDIMRPVLVRVNGGDWAIDLDEGPSNLDRLDGSGR